MLPVPTTPVLVLARGPHSELRVTLGLPESRSYVRLSIYTKNNSGRFTKREALTIRLGRDELPPLIEALQSALDQDAQVNGLNT